MSRTAIVGKQIVYRTKLLSEQQAYSYYRMMGKNPRFEGVTLVQFKDRSHVTYQPANPDRKADLHQRFQAGTEQRASEGDFEFVADSDSLNLFWCLNKRNGHTHAVTLFDCDCESFIYRCRGLGTRCVHMAALAAMKNVPPKADKHHTEANRGHSEATEEAFAWEGLI